jgi:hypothetical protein
VWRGGKSRHAADATGHQLGGGGQVYARHYVDAVRAEVLAAAAASPGPAEVGAAVTIKR